MFGLLRPKPPIGAWEKAWVETRMHWLAQQFVHQRLLESEVILPNEDHFPGDYCGNEEDARRYLGLVLRYMRADAVDLQVEVCEDCRCSPGSSPVPSEDGRPVIQIPQSCLTDPQLLVATLSHKVAYELLRHNRLLDELVDGPWVADLLTVFFGLGIFGANSTVRETKVAVANWSSWTTPPHGHLPTRMLGYALALFAWTREETSPNWMRYLRPDGVSLLQNSLRYLRRTGDSLFQHSTLHLQRSGMSVNELIADLGDRSDSVRIAALWSLAKLGGEGLAAADAVTDCLHAKDASVRAEAAATLATFGTVGDETRAALVECLRDVPTQVRASAARTLGVVAAGSQEVIRELAAALGDDHPDVVGAAALAIGQQKSAGAAALHEVLSALRTALIQCHNENAELLAATLQTIVPDAERQVQLLFDEYDSELRQVALEILAEQSTERAI